MQDNSELHTDQNNLNLGAMTAQRQYSIKYITCQHDLFYPTLCVTNVLSVLKLKYIIV